YVLGVRGEGVWKAVADTDTQKRGGEPPMPGGVAPEGETTAALVAKWVDQTRKYLSDRGAANMLLLPGFARRPAWSAMPDVFKLRAAAVAHYPMYRGLAKLVGMDALPVGP